MILQAYWFIISLAIGLAILLLHFWSIVRGIRFLHSTSGSPGMESPGIGRYYLRFSNNRLLEFFFFLLMLESPFISVLVIGLVFAPNEAIELLVSNWVAPFGCLCMAILMSITKDTAGLDDSAT